MNDTLIAEWRTTGKDFLQLFEAHSEKWGVHYHYKGNQCGGGLPPHIKTRDAAIAHMDNPWRHPEGTGACTVLRSDRSSLKRI